MAMNRRKFLKTAMGATAALWMAPRISLAYTTAPLPGVEQMADAFAQIEKFDYLVEHVYVHPDDGDDFIAYFSNLHGRHLDVESPEFRKSERILGYLWGAVVSEWPGMPQRRSVFISSAVEEEKRWWTPPMFKSGQPFMSMEVTHIGNDSVARGFDETMDDVWGYYSSRSMVREGLRLNTTEGLKNYFRK